MYSILLPKPRDAWRSIRHFRADVEGSDCVATRNIAPRLHVFACRFQRHDFQINHIAPLHKLQWVLPRPRTSLIAEHQQWLARARLAKPYRVASLSLLSLLASGLAKWLDFHGSVGAILTQCLREQRLPLTPGWVCGSHISISTPQRTSHLHGSRSLDNLAQSSRFPLVRSSYTLP